MIDVVFRELAWGQGVKMTVRPESEILQEITYAVAAAGYDAPKTGEYNHFDFEKVLACIRRLLHRASTAENCIKEMEKRLGWIGDTLDAYHDLEK